MHPSRSYHPTGWYPARADRTYRAPWRPRRAHGLTGWLVITPTSPERGCWLSPQAGTWVDDPEEARGRLPPGVFDFVWGEEGAAERALTALGEPAACGTSTCGVDFAVVRGGGGGGSGGGGGGGGVGGGGGGLELRVLEVNARTTMTHYARAAKRRFPRAR